MHTGKESGILLHKYQISWEQETQRQKEMKETLEERFRRKILKIGKKNKVAGKCMLPVLIVGIFFLRVAAYCRNNGKRFAMMAVTLLFFVVYSSFSFPAFIYNMEGSGIQVSEDAADITLAEETFINLEEIELLEDDDVRLEGETYGETSHGMDIVAKYSAVEILDSTPYHNSEAQREEYAEPAVEDGENSGFSKDDWRLVLINKQHSIPEDYSFTLGSINTMKGSMYCDERIIDDLLDMLQAAKEDGITLAICSPYRDLAYQEKLFNRKVVRYMNRGMSYLEAYQLASQAVTVPGASEHQIGLALDIVTDSYLTLDEGFGDTPAGKWLAENSCHYGFILRYPKDKEYITGIEYEPWHFRYVGTEAATLMAEQGITLEEFWEDL